MKLTILLLPVLAYVASELYLANRFARDFPGTTLAAQGAWRFLPAPCRGWRNYPTYVRRLDGVVYRYNNVGLRYEEDIGPKAPDEFRVFVLGGSCAYGERAGERGQWQVISGQKTYPTEETLAGWIADRWYRGGQADSLIRTCLWFMVIFVPGSAIAPRLKPGGPRGGSGRLGNASRDRYDCRCTPLRG